MSNETNMALFNTFGFKGLELRDYFAAKAMQGICSTLNNANESYWSIIAEDAYKMADAMLKEREIENDPTKR